MPIDQAFSLCDAAESYPAWLDAIARAERYIHFESYIIRCSTTGWALSANAGPVLGDVARGGCRGALLQTGCRPLLCPPELAWLLALLLVWLGRALLVRAVRLAQGPGR